MANKTMENYLRSINRLQYKADELFLRALGANIPGHANCDTSLRSFGSRAILKQMEEIRDFIMTDASLQVLGADRFYLLHEISRLVPDIDEKLDAGCIHSRIDRVFYGYPEDQAISLAWGKRPEDMGGFTTVESPEGIATLKDMVFRLFELACERQQEIEKHGFFSDLGRQEEDNVVTIGELGALREADFRKETA